MAKYKSIVMIFLASALFSTFPVYAVPEESGAVIAEEGASEEKYLYITSDPFTDEDENHVPDEMIEENGTVYELQSVEYRDKIIPGGPEDVSDTIVYERVALDSEIPEEAQISVKDEALEGDELDVVAGKLKEYHFENEDWEDFSFVIVCEEPDARTFEFNGQQVTIDDADPLAEYKELLLEAIDATPWLYEIVSVEWEGEPYMDGDVPCQNLRAYGRAKVGDCVATYEGQKVLPDIKAREYLATYVSKVPETTTAALESESSLEETSEQVTVQETAETAAESSSEKGFWESLKDFLENAGKLIAQAIEWATETPLRTFLSITTILLLGFVIWLLMYLARKAKKDKEKL